MYVLQKKKTKKKKKNCISKTKKNRQEVFWTVMTLHMQVETVNQAAKVAPGITKGTKNDINNIAKQRIGQIISQGGK